MLAKFAEDERLEQLTKEARRQKMIQFKGEVERMLDERRAKLAAEREREMAELVAERDREKARLQIIEEERQRLLREHASKLFGYLPRVRSSHLFSSPFYTSTNYQKQTLHQLSFSGAGRAAGPGRRGDAGRCIQARVRQTAGTRRDRRRDRLLSGQSGARTRAQRSA